MRKVKEAVKNVWDCKRGPFHLTQDGLAHALGLSQSAVQKLLNDREGHPWTLRYLRKVARYTETPLVQLVPKEFADRVTRYDSELGLADELLLKECVRQLEYYYRRHGMSVQADRLNLLAGNLYAALDGTRPSPEQMEKAIEDVIRRQAVA